MEYSISKLSKLAGISTRTLRYYDEIGLLTPKRISSNGYRIYGQKEVDLLQQILFCRDMGLPLGQIQSLILSESYDRQTALESHLNALYARQAQLHRLIATVEKTISTMKGETTMTDQEKFQGFKEKTLRDNEQKYGTEIREKYGEDAVNASQRKYQKMTEAQYQTAEALSLSLNEALKKAFSEGDPASDLAQEVCAMHKQWLCCFWDSYSKEAHKGVTQMYTEDPRFTAYYDRIAVGCAAFLRDAVQIYCR